MRNRALILTGILLAAAVASPSAALAEWGCIAQSSDQFRHRTWGSQTEAEARRYTIELCQTGGHTGCRIMECRAGVDTQAIALSVWPTSGNFTRCIGNAKC
jgi:hypothetical protein